MLCQACGGPVDGDADNRRLELCAGCLDNIMKELTMSKGNGKAKLAKAWRLCGQELVVHGGAYGIWCECGDFVPIESPLGVDVCPTCGRQYRLEVLVQSAEDAPVQVAA